MTEQAERGRLFQNIWMHGILPLSHSEPPRPLSAWFQTRESAEWGWLEASEQGSDSRRGGRAWTPCSGVIHTKHMRRFGKSEIRSCDKTPFFCETIQKQCAQVLRKSTIRSAYITRTSLEREVSEPPTLSPRPLMEAILATRKLDPSAANINIRVKERFGHVTRIKIFGLTREGNLIFVGPGAAWRQLPLQHSFGLIHFFWWSCG